MAHQQTQKATIIPVHHGHRRYIISRNQEEYEMQAKSARDEHEFRASARAARIKALAEAATAELLKMNEVTKPAATEKSSKPSAEKETTTAEIPEIQKGWVTIFSNDASYDSLAGADDLVLKAREERARKKEARRIAREKAKVEDEREKELEDRLDALDIEWDEEGGLL